MKKITKKPIGDNLTLLEDYARQYKSTDFAEVKHPVCDFQSCARIGDYSVFDKRIKGRVLYLCWHHFHWLQDFETPVEGVKEAWES